MTVDARWNVSVNLAQLKNPDLANFLRDACQSNKEKVVVLEESLVHSIIDQFNAENEDLSIESALLIYHFIFRSSFPSLCSNLHKFVVASLLRMLSSPDSAIKLVAIESLMVLLEKEGFYCDSLVKCQLDGLFLQSLVAVFCDKKPKYMLETYWGIERLINKCNKPHSEAYLGQFDYFCKSFFLSALLVPEGTNAVEFRAILLKVASNLVDSLNVAVVLYLTDFLILFDCCLQEETCVSAFGLLHQILGLSWPVLKYNLQFVVRILIEHAARAHGDWIQPNFVKTLEILIECCGRSSVEFVYRESIRASEERGAFLHTWFPGISEKLL